jgi:nicotinamidase-related amidase
MKIFKTLIIMVALAQTVFSQDIQKRNTAILLIEFQKTWTEKGIFHKIIKKEYKQRTVLDNTKNLLSEARKNGIKVIQAPLILDKKDTNYKKNPFPARLLKRFTKGTWKAEFTDGIYEITDLVIEGRYGFDATEGSNLEKILRENNIRTVFVAGFTTDHCVKETMNSLDDKGFDCVMISDCTATKNNKLQQKIENEFTIITNGQLIDKIRK